MNSRNLHYEIVSLNKLGNGGKYCIIIREHQAIISEYYIKDYVIPHQNRLKIIALPT